MFFIFQRVARAPPLDLRPLPRQSAKTPLRQRAEEEVEAEEEEGQEEEGVAGLAARGEVPK